MMTPAAATLTARKGSAEGAASRPAAQRVDDANRSDAGDVSLVTTDDDAVSIAFLGDGAVSFGFLTVTNG